MGGGLQAIDSHAAHRCYGQQQEDAGQRPQGLATTSTTTTTTTITTIITIVTVITVNTIIDASGGRGPLPLVYIRHTYLTIYISIILLLLLLLILLLTIFYIYCITLITESN